MLKDVDNHALTHWRNHLKYKPAKLRRTWGRWALTGLFLLLMILGQVAGVYAAGSYTVQPGDTLSGIAARFGVTVDAIIAANSLPSRSTIYVNQVLTIPSPGSNAPQSVPPSSQTTYTVQPGDALSIIAVRYGTTTDALMRANGLTSTNIYAGQVLLIVPAASPALPAPTTPPATNQPPQANPATYTVQPGDNLITLAQRFGVSRESLATANGITPSSFLYVGQVLAIPGASTATVTPPPPPTPTGTAVAAQATTTPEPASVPAAAEPGKPVQYAVQPGDNLSSIAANFNTTIDALISLNKLNDGNFLRVGQVLTIVKGNDQGNSPANSAPPTEPAPPMGQFGPKWVDVNLTTEMMYAYEGQTPVFSSKMSSGVADHPTVEGTYRIYAKYKSTPMQGGVGADYYYIPDVPYTMYFYSGYALHGAYWHNNFGQPMSHGCVNLPVDASKWMFDWAPIGTTVVTHK